jgi:DNA-binding IclR family transcriptional regulator
MKKLGKNRDDQKRSNWGLVLRLLATGRCSSRIDLAKATGLTKATITQIVGDMISLGIF